MFAVKRRLAAACGALLPAAGLAGLLAACSSFGSSPLGSASSTDVAFVNASQTWDLDKNGTVTCEEWKSYAQSELRAADGDGDGGLNAQEWEKLQASDRLFEITGLGFFDANGDGKVTSEEMAGKQNPAFRLLDRNNDCVIAHDEKATVYSNAKPKDKGGGDKPPGPPGPGGR